MENDILSIFKAIADEAISTSQAAKIKEEEERNSKKRKISKISGYDDSIQELYGNELLAENRKLKKTVENQKETIKQQAYVISQMLDNQRQQSAGNSSQVINLETGECDTNEESNSAQLQRHGTPPAATATKEDIKNIENQLERITAAAAWMHSEVIYLEKLYANEKSEKQKWKSIAEQLLKKDTALNPLQEEAGGIIDLTACVSSDNVNRSQLVEEIVNRATVSDDYMKQSQTIEEAVRDITTVPNENSKQSQIMEENVDPATVSKGDMKRSQPMEGILNDATLRNDNIKQSQKAEEIVQDLTVTKDDMKQSQTMEKNMTPTTVSADREQERIEAVFNSTVPSHRKEDCISNVEQQSLHYITLDELYNDQALNCLLLTSQSVLMINKISAAEKDNWNIYFNSTPLEYVCIGMEKLFRRSDFKLQLTGKLVCNTNNKKKLQEFSGRIHQCALTHLQISNQIINFIDFQKLVSSKTILNFCFKNVTIFGEYEEVLEIDDILKELPLVQHFQYWFKYFNEVTPETSKLLLHFPQFKNLKTFKLCNVSRMFDLNSFAIFIRRHQNVKFILEYRWQQDAAQKEIQKIAQSLIIPSSCILTIQFTKK